jgi:hypothetical protein
MESSLPEGGSKLQKAEKEKNKNKNLIGFSSNNYLKSLIFYRI